MLVQWAAAGAAAAAAKSCCCESRSCKAALLQWPLRGRVVRRVVPKRELPPKLVVGPHQNTLTRRDSGAETETEEKVSISVRRRMASYASTAFTVQQQQYGGEQQQQQQYQTAEQYHKARAENEQQQQQLQQGNGCLNQQQMTDETGCPVVSSTSAHEQGANGAGDGVSNVVNGVRQHDNIGSIITMLIADQVRKVVSITLLPVSNLLLCVQKEKVMNFPK